MRDAKAAEAAVDAHAARDPDSRGVPALATRLTQAHFKSIPAGAGAGAAAAAPGAVQAPTEALGDEGKKQGAYGKVVTHSEGALSQLMHVDEVWAAVLYKTGLSASAKVTPLNAATATPAAMWCEDMLGRVSRSFAMVIRQLSPRLRSSIAVFYLVLRGLDTVEDDMTAFADGRTAEKLRHLRDFHTYLQDPSWCMQGVGQGDEATLLEEFGQVAATFAELPPGDQDVIADICAKMGAGMARFADRDLLEGTEDLAEYNLYCHFVAGLVGEGLTRLFVSSGAEDAALAADLAVANHMGLFLQKTNIIRDYLEDLVEGRAFWPRSVWSRYAPKLAALRGTGGPSAAAVPPGYTPGSAGSPEDPHVPAEGALGCLNHLIADAMCHVPHCLAYLAALQADDVFRFCAIPQIMAIATLDKLTSNTEVFTGVVKIRKGQAVSLIQAASNRHSVYGIFLHHLRSIMGKLAAHISATPGVAVVLAALLRTLNERSRAWGGYVPRLTDSFDVLLLAAAVVCVLYIIAFTGVPLVMWSAAAAEEEEAAGAKGIALSAPSPKAPTPPKYQVPTSEETFPPSSTQREGGALSSPPRGLRTRRGGMAE
ncbi:Fdft1 [Symbiodinium sp. KB8]|nr:Fdft1 [Symbiodinium sp. KB8]